MIIPMNIDISVNYTLMNSDTMSTGMNLVSFDMSSLPELLKILWLVITEAVRS